jgi:hypothetical protein
MSDEDMSDEERRARFEAWIASRPARVQAVIRAYPAIDEDGEPVCYRMTTNATAHMTIRSYDEPKDDMPVTLTIIHGRDSSLPGVATFGQPPEVLVPCGCGKWRWPTPEQLAATRRKIERRMRRRGLT